MAQYARPSSDVTAGLWTQTLLYQKIDEDVRSDSDYITSNNNTSPDTCEIALSSVNDPNQHTDHVVSYTYKKNSSGGHVINFTAKLMCGASEIASWTHNGIGDTFSLAEQTLTSQQAGNITDYGDLRLQFTRAGDTGGGPSTRRSAVVSWTQLEVPDVQQEESAADKLVAVIISGGGAK